MMLFKKKKKSQLIIPPFKISAFFTEKKKRNGTISVIVGIAILISSIQLSSILDSEMIMNFGAIAGVMIIIIPFGLNAMKKKRDNDSIDDNLPMFVLSLISSIESGNSLLRAVEEAASREMGSLTPHLLNLRANAT